MFAEATSAMFSVFGDPYLMALILGTTVIGVIIGALPGLGATTGAALLLPFTLTMEPVPAIAVLTTIYVSATFAGAITAILINTPRHRCRRCHLFGRLSAGAARRGRARAWHCRCRQYCRGCFPSIFVLAIAAPMLARVAYRVPTAGVFRTHCVWAIDVGVDQRRRCDQEPDWWAFRRLACHNWC